MGKKVTNQLESDLKAALYIRVSTQWQIDKDSLPLQRTELINYTKHALDIDRYEVFEDAGYSAKNTDRPAYQAMLARLRAGEFSHLVVWKIDRISRNLLDFSSMYNELKKLGVTFVSKNEQFDTSSAMGEAMLKIILVFAELERNMTSERVTAVMLSRAGSGQWNGGRVPYGYDYDSERQEFSINEDQAAAVRLMYNEYESIKSLVQVARLLNAKGIKSRKGREWTPTTLGIILRNPFYVGIYRYNYRDESGGLTDWTIKPEKEWIMIEDHHPAIIETKQWDNVQLILTKNRRYEPGSTYVRKNIHVFAGLLKCGYCGSYMVSSLDRERAGGYRPSIYACSRKRRHGDCDNKYISDRTLGPFVLNYIANIMQAQRSFGKTTTIQTLGKKLLRGDALSDVKRIESRGLQELYDMFRRSINQSVSYVPPEIRDLDAVDSPEAQERSLLLSEKRKLERAMARLKSLYLYDDQDLSEREYFVERKRLSDGIDNIDKRLAELDNATIKTSLSDADFIAQASFFILSQELTGKRTINYEKLIQKIDPKIIKDFVNSVAQNFCIRDGIVESIRFKNGLEQRFIYHDWV